MIRPIKIAVASGKGGTGKTLISTNLFYFLQKSGYGVTLVDCDAEEPNDLLFFTATPGQSTCITQKVPVVDENKCNFCGACQDYCNYHAIIVFPPARFIQVIDDLCHDCGACLVACKSAAILEKEVQLGEVTQYSVSSNATIIEARMKTGIYSPVPLIKKSSH